MNRTEYKKLCKSAEIRNAYLYKAFKEDLIAKEFLYTEEEKAYDVHFDLQWKK